MGIQKNGIRLGLMQYKNLLTGLKDVEGPPLRESYDLGRSPVTKKILFFRHVASVVIMTDQAKKICVGGGWECHHAKINENM